MGHLWHGATETGVRVGQDATHCATPTSTLHAREPKQTSAPGTESRYRTGTWSEAVVGSLPDVVSSYPAWLARPSLPTQTRVGDEDGDDDSHEAWKCAIHMQGADVSLQEFAFLGIVLRLYT
ncbi:hypothetical protein H112_07546 [Trichophyton rubrum D6]|uniref:Uncharacterized protein n=1 Tax=Trichophyton rubrum CBS 288.86 TaxID=1215330 RepID=A0A022VS06_TRIRU|nr:hypothetical protein H100_07573 [Trichophyton rubrum MR850]EZF38181.1 hypothetical protein H102_07536 [Trichophyton rubrum CBS 100081]EZF48855.1 hypothetical protein H103_07559 [Trichophyton rubrum CBS 288.86]EZF59526.1 hypothetical protein H104_07507 [Trichophyton rubrum CBS 289.86]EZF80883.1 hypothetical protein H110_07552 [Trichophyton rubrum MR1448]EZG21720.1 hypothetical protein H107_00278 [Trichophyton rubrum CBS 202.88]KDB29931.1 hypothetical protein H112_07546 [Trichophyton rubrum 